MKEKKKIYPNPKFNSAEEEEKYWSNHSPIEEGYAGDVQTEKQKRSSFLTIRFTGDELTKLRDLAAKKGLGPSTYIRSIIKDLLNNEDPAFSIVRKTKEGYPRVLQDAVRDKSFIGAYKTVKKSGEPFTDIAAIHEQIKVLVKALESTEILDQLAEKVAARIIIKDDLKAKKRKQL
jgi:predicted DNA binding CopG/RHH family protein